MKMNKNAYLFAAALVAGTMGMTSCQNEVDDLTSQWEGKTTDATIGFSLSSLPGTRSTAADVNLDGGDDIAAINNVAVIPMIGETPTTPIKFGNITGLSMTTVGTTNLSQPLTRSLQSTVDRFIVYGNMPDGIYGQLNESVTPKLADIKFSLSQDDTNTQLTIGGSPVNVYEPHGLYYYRDTKVAAPGKTQTGYFTGTGDDWKQVTWGTSPTTDAIGDAKNIKISDVRYAVGVLATAVFQDDQTNAVFYGASEDPSTTTGKIFANYGTAPVTVSGIVIYDQEQTLNNSFDGTGTLVPVYDQSAQNGGALANAKINHTAATGANFYTVVAPTEKAKGIGISIEFTVAEGAKMVIKNADGTATLTRLAGEKFYMQATLAPETADKSVFAAATSTLLNATIKDWGKATENPEQPTDANVGIEFDASWMQGVVYDIEI